MICCRVGRRCASDFAAKMSARSGRVLDRLRSRRLWVVSDVTVCLLVALRACLVGCWRCTPPSRAPSRPMRTSSSAMWRCMEASRARRTSGAAQQSASACATQVRQWCQQLHHLPIIMSSVVFTLCLIIGYCADILGISCISGGEFSRHQFSCSIPECLPQIYDVGC